MNLHARMLSFGRWSPMRFKSTWREFRHGQEPHGKKKKDKGPRHKPIYSGEKRKHIVHQVMDAMSDWRYSHFEYEGTCRAAIRASLCLQGNDWTRSDTEAADIVGEALKALGASRPSWIEGQAEYSVSQDYCAWCHVPMEGGDSRGGHRFCSPLCARSSLIHRNTAAEQKALAVRQSAWRVIMKEKRPAQPCGYCGTSFHPREKQGIYCSRSCSTKAKQGSALLSDVACGWCGDVFKPRRADSRYCCQSCAAYARNYHEKQRLAGDQRECKCCGLLFVPQRVRSECCSPRCNHIMAKRRLRAKRRDDAPSNVITLVIRRIEQIEEMMRAA